MYRNRKILNELVGKNVRCGAPNHEGVYIVFEVSHSRNGAKIQRPDEHKAHWVSAKTLTITTDPIGSL